MRGWVAVVGGETLPGGVVRSLDLGLALRPALKRVLPMREGKTGISAGEGRIEADRHLEEMPGAIIVRLVEPVHVPQATMVRFPGVERVRRFEDGAVALVGLDLPGNGSDDAIPDLHQNEESIVEASVKGVGPNDASGARFGQFD